MKKTTAVLIGLLFLVPGVSFAQTTPSTADLLKLIASIEQQILVLQAEIAAQQKTPLLGSVKATTSPEVIPSTDPVNIEEAENAACKVYTNNVPFKDTSGDTLTPVLGTTCVTAFKPGKGWDGSMCGC